MNRPEGAAAYAALAIVWPQMQTDAATIELWYKNVLSATKAEDVEEIVGRLTRDLVYAPKPADWWRVRGEIEAEKRRAAALDIRVLEEPRPDPALAKRKLAELREMLGTVGHPGDLDAG
jgi:hypothetical protein